MSRLFDRFLANGCPPFQLSNLFTDPRSQTKMGERCAQLSPADAAKTGMTNRELGQLLLREFDCRGTVRLEPEDLVGAVVIAADNVADYCTTLPDGTHTADVITTVAPPFEQFFLEFAPTVTNPPWGLSPLHAWGYLCHGADLTVPNPALQLRDRRLPTVMAALGATGALPPDLARTEVRWLLRLSLVLEPRKGHPMGPVAEYEYFLDDEGCLIGRPDGSVVSLEGIVRTTGTGIFADYQEWVMKLLDRQMTPALFAISLVHCKNVRIESRDPPAALSRKAQRRDGRPLVRYHVVEIGAMRRILDTEGKATGQGLAQALHICRGHFKTFTVDAPLFGKHVGRYFWHDTARGNPQHGAITSDYQVNVPGDH